MNSTMRKPKRLLSLVLAVVMVLGLFPAITLPVRAAGIPTTSWANNIDQSYYTTSKANYKTTTEFLVDTPAKLAALAKLSCEKVDYDWLNFNGKTIKLTANIDLSAHLWVPFTSNTDVYNKFYGTFDGNGKTITGMTITSAQGNTDVSNKYVGLFARADGATLKNVNLANVLIDMKDNQNQYTGALVGQGSYSDSIFGITVTGAVYGGYRVGGVAGEAGFISNSTNYATVTCGGAAAGSNKPEVGGIVGRLNVGMMGCANNGAVTVNFNNTEVGGLLGHVNSDRTYVYNSYNTAAVSVEAGNTNIGNGTYVGGLAGQGGIVKNSYNLGAVSITASWAGNDKEYKGLGGIAGYMYNTDAIIENCYNNGTLTLSDGVTSGISKGGLVGRTYNEFKLKNSYWLAGTAEAGYGYLDTKTPVYEGCGTFANNTITPVEGHTVLDTNLPTALNAWVTNNSGSSMLWNGWTTAEPPVFHPKRGVSGTITAVGGGALAGVSVTLSNEVSNLETVTTDSSGNFSFASQPANVYGITAVKAGYLTVTYSVVNDGSADITGANCAMIAPAAPSGNAIASVANLAYVAQQVNSGANSYNGVTLTLGSNLTFPEGAYWAPIGTLEHPFMGSFNGGNNSISGLKVSTNAPFAGLFGVVGHDLARCGYDENGEYTGEGHNDHTTIKSTIEKLNLPNASVKGGSSTGGLVGGVKYSTKIADITVSGTVSSAYATATPTGGVIGAIVSGEVINVTMASGSVQGLNNVGGVIGNAGSSAEVGAYGGRSNVAMENLTNGAAVGGGGNSGGYNAAAGIVSRQGSSETSCCGGSGNEANTKFRKETSLKNAVNTGTVTSSGGAYAGGIAGYFGSTIYNAQNSGVVNGNSGSAGGIFGSGDGFKCAVYDSSNSATVTGNYAGGIGGNSANVIINCSNSGAVTGGRGAGGIAGNGSKRLVNNYNTGAVHITTTGQQVSAGGIAPSYATYMANNYSTGKVTALETQQARVGALIGGNYSSSSTIKNNYYLAQDGLTGQGYVSEGAESTYTGNASFDATQALSIDGEGTIIGGKTTLLEALTAYVDSTEEPAAAPWAADTENTNGGYPVYAPVGTLSGKLTEDNTATGIGSATVKFYDLSGTEKYSVTTGTDGAYTVPDMKGGTYLVEITKAGYATTRFLQSVSGDTEKNIKVIKTVTPTLSGGSYQIDSIGKLAYVSEAVNAGTAPFANPQKYTITKDLDLTGFYWTPIGTMEKPFKHDGFNGTGKTITGLYINAGKDNQGLFGVEASDYTTPIQNIIFANPTVIGRHNVGTLVGRYNSYNINDITVTGGKVTGVNSVGGIIGSSGKATLKNLTFAGNINAIGVTSLEYREHAVGGIVGYSTAKSMENLTASGTISVNDTDASVGGIAGSVAATVTTGGLKNCVSRMDITATGAYSIGGIVGTVRWNYSDTKAPAIMDSRNEGSITVNGSSRAIGGIVGEAGGDVVNCANVGDIAAASSTTGGLVGVLSGNTDNSAYLLNSYNAGDITGSGWASGIVGSMVDATNAHIRNAYSSGSIVATGGGANNNGITNEYKKGVSSYQYAYWLDGSASKGAKWYTSYEGAEAIDLHCASFGADGTLTPVPEKSEGYDANPLHTVIGSKTTLLAALNEWVNTQKGEYSAYELVNWTADNVTTPVNGGQPIFSLPATLTYDGNGHTGGAAPVYSGAQLYTGGETVLAGSGNLVKTGHTFAGWNTEANGGGTDYAAGATFPIANVSNTLYARWAKGLANTDIAVTSTHIYNGANQIPSFVLSIKDGSVTLVKDAHYTVTSFAVKNGGTVTDITNAGTYTATLTGMGGYTGTATVDFTVAPKTVTIVDTDYVVTKVYDGTAAAPAAPYANINTSEDGVTAAVTAISAYSESNAGTRTVTLTLGALSDAQNYTLGVASTHLFTKAAITPKIVASIEQGNLAISKKWNNSAAHTGSSVTGSVVLKDVDDRIINERAEDFNISITYGDYPDAAVGKNKNITLTLGALTGPKAKNYQKDEDFPTEVTYAVGSITGADYVVNTITPQSVKVGSGLSKLKLPTKGIGVSGADVTGTFALFSDAGRTTEAVDEDISTAEIGDVVTLYWSFTPDESEGNYDATPKTGTLVINISDGDPQYLEFETEDTLLATYGDTGVVNAITSVTTVDDAVVENADITYTSDNEQVATVDENGAVTIVGAGTATIKATAAAVHGVYSEGSSSYVLTVEPKELTIAIEAATKVYGEANPAFTFTVEESDLVGEDDKDSLDITLSAAATELSSVGNYEITFTCGNGNYSVSTEESAYLTISQKPVTVTADNKSRLYGEENPVLTFTVPEGTLVATDTAEMLMVTLSCDANATTTGTAAITGTSDSENYDVTVTAGVLTILDKYDLSAAGTSATGDQAAHYKNQGKYTVEAPVRIADTNEFTVAVKGTAYFDSYASANEAQGTAKWMDLVIGQFTQNDTPIDDVTTLYVKTPNMESYTQLTAADVAEANVATGDNGAGKFVWSVKTDSLSSFVIYIADNAQGTNAIKLTFNYTAYTSGGGGGGGGSVTPPPASGGETTSGSNLNTEAKLEGGTANATVTEKGIDNAMKSAGTNGNVVLNVTVPEGAKNVNITLPAASADSLASAKNSVTVNAGLASITFSGTAINTIAGAGKGDVSVKITAVDQSSLPANAKEIIGNRPVFDFSVTNGNTQVTNFGGGTATVSVPYTLKPGENPAGIVIFYLAGDNTMHMVTNCVYDVASGRVLFNASHFSKYAVGYSNSSFIDVPASAWYEGAVSFVAARGLFGGVGDNQFAPLTTTTRAMFVTVLARLNGADLSGYTTSAFTDVDINAYYGKAVAWAADKGIVGGIGDGLYAPDQNISREEMAVMLANYIRYTGITLKATGNSAAFADNEQISPWAKDAVAQMKKYGIISGVGTGEYNPKGNATRAEVAKVFQNYLTAIFE